MYYGIICSAVINNILENYSFKSSTNDLKTFAVLEKATTFYLWSSDTGVSFFHKYK